MSFGNKLQKLRKSSNMSQEELGAKVTVSRQAISKWELGESMPDTENVIQLSKIFEVSIDYLLKDEFKSDSDIPAVKENSILLKNTYKNKLQLILGIIMSSIGALGVLTIWVLSTMIKVHITVPRELIDGTIEYYGGGDIVGYNFLGFITEYRLMAVLVILIILLIVGISLIFIRIRSNKLEEKMI